MRIAGHQRQAGGRAFAGDDPCVAAAVGRAGPAEQRGGLGKLFVALLRRAVEVLSGRYRDQLPRLVAREQLRGAGRTQRRRYARPPQLHRVRAHRRVAHLEHGQALPRRPGLRPSIENGVLDRKGHGRIDERVHTGGVGVKHGARLAGGRLVVGLRRTLEAHPAEQAVLRQRRLPRELGPSAQHPVPVVVHVPEPVLRCCKSLGEERVRLVLGPDVRDAPPVTEHGHRPSEVGQTES